MDEDRFNMEVRKFLKKLGVTSQREIEDAVRRAVETGALAGNETLSAKAVVTVSGVDLEFTVDGEIVLN